MENSDPDLVTPLHIHDAIDLLNQQILEGISDDPAHCVVLCKRAIELATQGEANGQPYPQGLSQCLHHLGRLQLQLGDYSASLDSFLKALALFEELGDRRPIVLCLSYVGTTYAYLGAYPDALQYLFKSLEGAREIGCQDIEATILNDIGHLHTEFNEPATALPYLHRSLEICQSGDDKTRLGWVLDSLCHAYLGVNDYECALQYGLQSVQLSREIGAWKNLAENLHSAGRVYHVKGELDKALVYYQESLQVSRKYGYRRDASIALRHIGDICAQQGQPEQALAALQEALALAEVIEARQLLTECCQSLAAFHKQQGDFEQALAYFERFHTLKENVFSEEAAQRIKNLQTVHQVETARKEAEIYQLKNMALQREIDERKQVQARLEQLANTDELTGLLNRRRFFADVGQYFERAQRCQKPLSILEFDIDNFKQINDTCGHMVGDQVLRVVARRALENIRREDVVARFGGDEFLILLPDAGITLAYRAAERLRKSIVSQPVAIENRLLHLTISIGVASTEGGTCYTLGDLLKYADQALYSAKQAGRDQVVMYSCQNGNTPSR